MHPPVLRRALAHQQQRCKRSRGKGVFYNLHRACAIDKGHIKPALGKLPPWFMRQEFACCAANADHLAPREAFGGTCMASALLDLDEDDRIPFAGDKIDFAAAATPAPGLHPAPAAIVKARHLVFGGKSGMIGSRAF